MRKRIRRRAGIYPTSPRRPKKAPRAIVKSRVVKPDIYVKPPHQYIVKAHIRQRGKYRYLRWREDGKVKEFYLGSVKNSSPTGGAGGRAAPTSRSRAPRGVKKSPGGRR